MTTEQNDETVESQSKKLLEKLSLAPKLTIGEAEFYLEPEEVKGEFKERAVKELRETSENVENALVALRELLKNEPDLIIPTDSEHLRKFLRPCKWYPDSSYELIKRFYRYRYNNPRYCSELYPANERVILSAGILTPIPKRNADGSRVFLIEGGRRWKPKEVSLDQIFRGVILFIEAAMSEPKSQVAGVRVILDMDGLSISHVTYFTPSFASAVVEFVQRCLPVRLKSIHIINQPIIFNMVYAIFKPFLIEKIRKRLHFHGSDREALLKFIDRKSLPKQYGGDLEFNTVGEELYNYLIHFNEDFVESSQVGYKKT